MLDKCQVLCPCQCKQDFLTFLRQGVGESPERCGPSPKRRTCAPRGLAVGLLQAEQLAELRFLLPNHSLFSTLLQKDVRHLCDAEDRSLHFHQHTSFPFWGLHCFCLSWLGRTDADSPHLGRGAGLCRGEGCSLLCTGGR